ncbi:MAG: AMIN domain-containing protein [Candidatus Competibacteraceae bacterium]|nr:AMIN domain-containing protein [Candidatus Competibacteraceae bacterium]
MRLIGWMLLLLLTVPQGALAAVQVDKGRIVEQAQGSQVIFTLNAPVNYSSFLLDNPPRLVVDLNNTQLRRFQADLGLRSTDVQTVRAGVRRGVNLRLVVDLTSLRKSTVYTEPTNTGQRLVIAIDRTQRPNAVGQDISTGGSVKAAGRRGVVRQVPLQRDIIVAIDPGHGGKDPGAMGPRKTLEKDVVMKIAKQLKQLVDQEAGMRAILTRSSDKYLRLYQRIDIARQHNADLFISIHADAFDKPSARGSSVFILSTKGASSAAARWLAKKENEADLVGGKLANVEGSLKPVVFDIYHDAVLADSHLLAEEVLVRLAKIGHIHSNHVERAGFAVLKGPDMPSILVETAFISNPEEESKLRSNSHRQELAKAIFNGIRAYLKKKPPQQQYLLVAESTSPEPVAPVATASAQSRPAPIAVKPEAKPVAKPIPPPQSIPLPKVRLVATGQSAYPPVDLIATPIHNPSAPAATQVHVTRRGESLADIAHRYRIDLRHLRAANGLRNNQLRMPVGTPLTIPVSDS